MISYTRTLVARCIRLGQIHALSLTHTHTRIYTNRHTRIPEGSFSVVENVTQLSQLMHNLIRYVVRRYAYAYLCVCVCTIGPVCVISEQVLQFKIKFWYCTPTKPQPVPTRPVSKSISIFHDSRVVCNTFCRFTLRAASVLLLCWSTNLPLAVSEAKHLPFVLQLALQFRLNTKHTFQNCFKCTRWCWCCYCCCWAADAAFGTNKLRFTANVCKLDDVTYTTEQNVRSQLSSALQQKWLKTPTNHPAWMWMLSETKASALELTQRLEVLQSVGGASWQLLTAYWKILLKSLSEHMMDTQRRSQQTNQ